MFWVSEYLGNLWYFWLEGRVWRWLDEHQKIKKNVTKRMGDLD